MPGSNSLRARQEPWGPRAPFLRALRSRRGHPPQERGAQALLPPAPFIEADAAGEEEEALRSQISRAWRKNC